MPRTSVEKHRGLAAPLDKRDALNEEITSYFRTNYPPGYVVGFIHDRGVYRRGRVLNGSYWGVAVENVATGKRRKIDLRNICED